MDNHPVRPRRLRASPTLRNLTRQTELSVSSLVQPLFIVSGTNIKREISSLSGQFHWSVDICLREVEELVAVGVNSVLLFGIPDFKDDVGSAALKDDGVVQRATRAIKERFPSVVVITDLCFCEYTSHGHCGAVRNGHVDNDLTLEMLGAQALSHAKAGADIIAPSGMMDGMVEAIRTALDAHNYQDKIIMSYAAKYASSFYGPFRDAAQCAPQEGDRKGYQMDPRNAFEALREVELDIQQGADIVMVKPALAYLDIIWRIKERFEMPTAAYHVSGEYASVCAAAERGWLDKERALCESLVAIKRSGADIIITYWAKEAAKLIGSGEFDKKF